MSVLSRVDVTRTRSSTKTCPDAGPGTSPVRLTIQKVSGEHQRSFGRAKLGRKSHGGAPRRTLAGSQHGRDLLTSHFEPGSRGVVLAALQQRSHSASQRRKVKVQLLEPQQRNNNNSSSSSSSSSSNAAGGHKGAQSLSCNLGDNLSTKKKDHMGVGVCQQVDTIDRDDWASRMEAVHRRQLELQNQLLQSALSIVARCTSSNQEPPAVQQVDPAEALIKPSTRTSVESDTVTMGTHTDHTRCVIERRRARVVSVATQANDSPAAPAHAESEAPPPPPPSALEEARRLLRRLRRHKKILDDNLETAERARGGELLRCQLEALAANSEWSQRARVKKTVDAWIHLMGKDAGPLPTPSPKVPARMVGGAAERGPAAPSARPRSAVKALGGTTSGRPPAGRGQRSRAPAPERVPAHLLGSLHARGQRPACSMPRGGAPGPDESYLTRLYGRAPRKAPTPTPGIGRSPPLRFNLTAPPVNRKPRPQALDAAKGATTKAAPRRSSRPPSAESDDLPRQGSLAKVPSPSVAIPLARPRIGPSPGCRRGESSPPVAFSLLAHAEAEQETPERAAAGPPPAPDPPSQPSPAPPEEDRELADDEGLEVEPDSPEALEREQAEPPDDGDAAETVARESRDEPDEGGEIPGRDFLSMADAVLTTSNAQEESAGGEGAFDRDGDPSPPLLVYRGPLGPAEDGGAVPPPPCGSPPNLDDRTLDRMVQWLERQLMARMIRGRSPPPPPAPPEPNEQSDAEDPSPASSVAEAASGGALPFLADAGVQVDSPFVKELLNEVLSEMVDQVLAPREPPLPGPAPDRGPNPSPGGPSSFQEKSVPVVATPVPTPPPNPVASIQEPLPLCTPTPSEATSLPMDDSPPPSVAAPPEPVATPIPSPEASPPAEFPSSEVADAPSSGKAGLPSDDEEEHPDGRSRAQVEEAVGSPPRAPSPAAPPPRDDPKSPSSASDDATSTASSSNGSTVTGSETGLKAVSEGELLISFQHVDAATEADTSSGSLQDEDLEPPSEGQVKVHMLETAHTLRGERSLEEEELSSGEVTDSIAPQPDGKINRFGEAILKPTNGGVDFDPTPSASPVPTSDLQSEASQVLPFRRSSPQAGQPEVSVTTSAPPEKMSPSSEDSSDFF
ncbi:protein TALPID3 isoform X2 [Hippocampus zosterae]|uniref:protein TALPID3 isoform X2 n=1 Tax=Hippocampus zosterae TaxID=109293 RepID=UPI00223CC454|nr:protein TALPID3 isoform X2 [Hippocampus zosterae]